MEFLSEEGAGYRTRLLTEQQAQRYAKCLEANPNFTNVVVHEESRSRGSARHYVTFLPASSDRQDRIASRHQARRQETARQLPLLQFLPDPSEPDTYIYTSPSGKAYRVTPNSCDCLDFFYRCSACGINCKHIVALRSWIERTGATE